MDATTPAPPAVTLASGPDGVHGTKAGCGQGEEDGRISGNCFGDALSTLETRPHQMASIAPVDLGAGRATHLAPLAAGLEKDPVGQRGARVGDVAPIGVARNDIASQADRMAAPGAAISLGQALIELATATVAHQGFEHGVVLRIHGDQGASTL